MGFWPVVLNVLRNSDVVLLLVDARMPEIGRNSEIVANVKKRGKGLIYVFNKIDLVGRGDVEVLRREYPDGFFVSATKRIGVRELRRALDEMAKDWKRSSLRVGIVGYPNIGKSTLINLLVPGARTKVSPVSGTTKKTQWIRSGRLRIMDSPGVIPFGDRKVQIGMTAAKDPHKIKNPEKVAIRIIEFLMKRDKRLLKKYYGAEGKDAYGVFEDIGRRKGYLVKGGEVDENRVAIKVIEDWQRGRVRLG
jgi:ribosome biogenesis GTPase A